jgi:hypothetical protein
MYFFSPLIPYFNFKACYLQSERISLNWDWDSIPQYLMLKIQNNYDNSKHSNSKGTKEKIKMMKLRYTKFCDNLNFSPHLNAMCFLTVFFSNFRPSWSNLKFWYIVSFISQISLFSSKLFSLYSKSNVSISFLWIWFCRSINLSMEEGSLFCFVVMRSTEPGCFRSWSWSLWKALDEEGCMGLVPWRLDLWCKSSWIWNDFFTEKKLNRSWKFQRNWNVPLVLLERSWWAGLNGIYLWRFGLRMWEIVILSDFCRWKFK